MNLQQLSDQELLNGTKQLVKQEREILTEILHRLREVERRRLFSSLDYPSLFAYAIGELKYSEDQAARRISAMRLLRDVPEIEEKINSGALSLSNLCLAQTLFTKERQAGRPVSIQAKVEVLTQLENQSAREAKKVVAAINPEMKKTKALDFDLIEDEALREKLLQVKGLFAHINPNMTLDDVLHRLCDSELAKKSKSPATSRVDSLSEVRRQVWRRDGHKCTKCSSTYAIQIDHILPKAAGGLSTLDNLRLLCRSCNQRAAINYFGSRKMETYLKSPAMPYHPIQSKSCSRWSRAALAQD